jgi:hypothetical protein
MALSITRYQKMKEVYKSCNNFIVTLKIDLSEQNNLCRKVYDDQYAKYRCKRALVVSIVNKDDEKLTWNSIASDFTNSNLNGGSNMKPFIYKVGEWVETEYDDDATKVCAKGIHFYKSKEAAFYHSRENYLPFTFTGEIKMWSDDGHPIEFIQYDGGYVKKVTNFHDDGRIALVREF